MSEARLLSLVARYPNRIALARRVRDRSAFEVLRRLEDCGYVRRRRDEYRLTRTGRDELELTFALLRLATGDR